MKNNNSSIIDHDKLIYLRLTYSDNRLLELIEKLWRDRHLLNESQISEIESKYNL